MSEKGVVYTLVDPRTAEPVYVGATKNPESRLQNHKHNGSNEKVQDWVGELESVGKEPYMEIIEEVSLESLADCEQKHIDSMSEDHDLFNGTQTSSYSHKRGGSKEYTTIRVSKDAKAEAQEAKRDGETWNEYLQRCTETPPNVQEFVPVDEVVGREVPKTTVQLEATEYSKIADELEGRLR